MDAATRRSIHYSLSLYGRREARHVLSRLEAGQVQGLTFMDGAGCGCLLGTMESKRTGFTRWWELRSLTPLLDHAADTQTSRAQAFFALIKVGDTPESHRPTREAAEAIQKWLADPRNRKRPAKKSA
jgi:hypothetical protein